MAGISKKNSYDLAFAVACIVVVLMLLIPLPTLALDFFMACNILSSILVLLTVVYSKKATDFSVFPTLLLILTVFSLGINVASTKAILSQGENFDGKMVIAFSKFVIGAGTNNEEGLLIGFVIFIILIAVQVMVISKGASRVAEVAARFTLDGMPLKMNAVDGEFHAGAITEEEARRRKLEIQKESDFYGNMDGSTKFVSGSVKLGILITVINLVVGIIFGMVLRHESFGDAIKTYAKFTIGDGLLSQIPSLLISLSTGLIVTRSASDGTTLGDDVHKQFSQHSWVYVVAGGTMAVIGILPGFPWYILLPMGAALIYIGWRLANMQKVSEIQAKEAENRSKQKQTTPTVSNPVVPLDDLSLELGYGLLSLTDPERGGDLKERIGRIRHELGLELGLVVPSVHLVDNILLDANEYCFKIRGVEVNRGQVRPGWYMALATGNITEEIPGEPTVDPAFGLPAILITEDNRDKAERCGYSIVDAPTIIATHLTEMLKSHGADILGRQEVQAIIDETKKKYPAVVEEAIGLFSLGQIQKVMQGLLREKVSIRDTVAILETMADYGPITKETTILVEKVRQRLGRHICLQYADADRVLHVLTVAQSLVVKIADKKRDTINGPILAFDPNEYRAWIQAVKNNVVNVQNMGYYPIILCPEEVRLVIKRNTEQEIPGLVVISVPELINDIKVESLGEINV